jgi:hypothetical protein
MPKSQVTKKALVRRVKKAVKKSRRKLGAEKFEKELKRTIDFLAKLQSKLKETASRPVRTRKKTTTRKATPSRSARNK